MNANTKTENQALSRTVLELDVNNHAGVMSHVVGLFSRRAYNVEGILVMPVGNGETSRIWMMVNEEARLEQMVNQKSWKTFWPYAGTVRRMKFSSAWRSIFVSSR